MPGPAPTVYSPFRDCGIPQAYSITSRPRCTSPLASAMTLPCSLDNRWASWSMFVSTSSLNLNIARARRCGLVAAQAGWAALAASIAFWRSAAVPKRTLAWTWPWLGSNTSPCRSPLAKAEPPMKWSMLRSMGTRPRMWLLKVAAPLDPGTGKCQLPHPEQGESPMRKLAAFACVALIGAAPPPSPDAQLRAIVAPVSAARLKASIEKLVSFGTRHTLSSQTDPKRGIGAALNWAEGEFKSLGLPTTRPCETFTGERLPSPTRVCDMVAIQLGTERPNDVVIITAHIDSRVSDPLNANAFEPGANDDGSGSAAVLEAARILSKRKFPGTIVYSLDSGEEQGLYGAKVIAAYAKAQGWNVIADLNNDIIGNSCG